MKLCPVCNNTAVLREFGYNDGFSVKCNRCGKFKITSNVIEKIKSPEAADNIHIYILSYWIKQHQNDDIIEINRELFKSIIKETTLPYPQEKSDNLIQLIGKKQNNRHSKLIEFNIEKGYYNNNKCFFSHEIWR